MRSLTKLLYEYLNINLNKKEIISFVGGGGKTTTLFTLAEELKNSGKKVLITTTTNIIVPDEDQFNYLFLEDIKDNKINPSTITILGGKIIEGKLKGLDQRSLEKIVEKNLFDFVLIEADGAKRMPIKAPNSSEPVFIDSNTKTIGLIGLDALDKTITETSHRQELLSALLEKNSSDIIGIEDITKLVLHKNGLFKGSIGENILILNKAMDEKIIGKAKLIRRDLSNSGFKSVIIANILSNSFY